MDKSKQIVSQIHDVVIESLNVMYDERGWLMEIMRLDNPIFNGFGQVYVTTAYPEVVKAWHLHRKQTDMVACISGIMQLVLYDNREDSPTKGEVEEIFLGGANQYIVKIPPNVFHGFKAIGTETAYFLNVTDKVYDYEMPDEYRVAADSDLVPFDWSFTPGKVNN